MELVPRLALLLLRVLLVHGQQLLLLLRQQLLLRLQPLPLLLLRGLLFSPLAQHVAHLTLQLVGALSFLHSSKGGKDSRGMRLPLLQLGWLGRKPQCIHLCSLPAVA